MLEKYRGRCKKAARNKLSGVLLSVGRRNLKPFSVLYYAGQSSRLQQRSTDKISECAVNCVVRLRQNWDKNAVHGVVGTCSDCGVSLERLCA